MSEITTVYGCDYPDFGIFNQVEPWCGNSSCSAALGYKCTGGVLAAESVALLRRFYEQGNPNGMVFFIFDVQFCLEFCLSGKMM